jgi:hypothetical protein
MVVFPTPGGPQSTMLGSMLPAKARRSTPSGPTR